MLGQSLAMLQRTLLLSGLCLSACSIAPPARIGGGGAPGRSLAHSGEVNLGAVVLDDIHYANEPMGYAGAGFSPAKDWRLEAGFESMFNYPHAYAGVRYNAWKSGTPKKGGILDVEGGLAAGVGANGCENASGWCDDGDGFWNLRRITGGGYVGSGIGLHRDWFDLYGRARMQVTGAQGSTTHGALWYAAQAGVQFNINRFTHFYMATAGAGVTSLRTGGIEPMWVPLDLGIVFTFGGERQKGKK